MGSPRRTRLLLALACLSLGACVGPADVNLRMLPYVQNGNHAGALQALESAKRQYGDKNAVLYHLERGMLQHYAGNYAESNESLERAKRLAELNYTRSITAEASTFLANDNTRPYYGENFERALLHVFGALNYRALGQADEALVEIRQLNFFLRQLVVEDGQDNHYRDDAFAHYLAAIFFEEDGDWDEAWVAYRKALDAYEAYREVYDVPPPRGLRRDARRLVARLGQGAEVEFEQRYGAEPLVPAREGRGRVVLVHYNGRAPVKIDTFIDIAFVQGWPYVNAIDVEGEDQKKIAEASRIATSLFASDVVRIAFPEYREVPRRIRHVDVQPRGGGRSVRAELVEDIGAIAQQDLADRIARIRAKAIARAVVKYALSKIAERAVRKTVDDDYRNLAGAVLSVGSALARTASEVADKRGWFTVPDEIWMCQLDLEPGDRSLKLTYRDRRGDVVREDVADVHVERGRRTFVVVRTVQ